MELGGGGRRSAGDRVRRQLQSVGRLAAYLGGGFLLLSAAASVGVRSLRALSDANQVRASPSILSFLLPPAMRLTDPSTLSEEVRYAVRCLRGEGDLRVQALPGKRHHRVVSDARSGVRQSMPLPYLRWDQVSPLLQNYLFRSLLLDSCHPCGNVVMIWILPPFFFQGATLLELPGKRLRLKMQGAYLDR